jgi:hypothetical protein
MAPRITSDAQLGCSIALLDDGRSAEDIMCSSAAILPGSTVALRLQFQPLHPRRENILKAVWELEPCTMPLFQRINKMICFLQCSQQITHYNHQHAVFRIGKLFQYL